jgi:hypothetical protein
VGEALRARVSSEEEEQNKRVHKGGQMTRQVRQRPRIAGTSLWSPGSSRRRECLGRGSRAQQSSSRLLRRTYIWLRAASGPARE